MINSKGEKEGEIPTKLSLLEKANLSHWTTPVKFAVVVQ
jgi:hypothetical protein